MALITAKQKAKAKNLLKQPTEIQHLENLIGLFIEYWGFKKIHGRIWTHLFTSNAPLDSMELMNRLDVSKGLMSLAIRDLLDHNVIMANHVGRHGSIFYAANPDLIKVISDVLRNREMKMLSEVKTAGKKLLKMNVKKLELAGLNHDKVHSLLEFTNSAFFILQSFLEQDHVNS